ncbi:MAG: hypothetical protein JWO13_2249 [Acidobacteriales bacterium]|nr:hypothetical protein [Terriglobales bacterium]
MRGIPNVKRQCSKCPSMDAGRDDLCNLCRLRSIQSPMKYPFSAAHDELVRRAWASGGSNRKQLKAAITDATRRIGYPRHIVRLRAQRLGLSNDTRRPWTPAELAQLDRYSGTKSAKQIARILKRGFASVASQMDARKISRAVLEGYTRTDVTRLMGVDISTVNRWLQARYFALDQNKRISERTFKHFLRVHPELYSLKRVDERLFKALVFGDVAAVYRPPTGFAQRMKREDAA